MLEAIHNSVLAQVSQKLLLRRGKELLILRDDDSPNSDIPGGRINVSIREKLSRAGLLEEFEREVREELDADVVFELKPMPIGTSMHLDNDGVPIFSVFYEGEYISGEIVISPEHESMRWVSVDTYDPAHDDQWKKPYEEFMVEYVKRVR